MLTITSKVSHSSRVETIVVAVRELKNSQSRAIVDFTGTSTTFMYLCPTHADLIAVGEYFIAEGRRLRPQETDAFVPGAV